MKKAVMYGAGNIGRGFLGEVLAKSGYATSFIDVNEVVINALNEKKSYVIEVCENAGNSEYLVENVCGIDGRDVEAVAKAIAEADVMATAVGVNVLSRIAKNIADGIALRFQNGNFTPLNIIICENLINSDEFLRAAVKAEISDEFKEKIDATIGFVEASIGRMVPLQTPEMNSGDPLKVCVEAYNNLVVDKDGFRGEIPYIFNMSSYPSFDLYIKRKLFIHNMSHSMTAYLGYQKGYEYIWQAIEDPSIEIDVIRAALSSAMALSKKYDAPLVDLYMHIEDLLRRFRNKKLGDTVFRVGRDIKRKLSPDDRLVGAINLCIETGIDPKCLYLAVAAATKFDVDEDAKNMSPEQILTDICKFSPDSTQYKEILKLL